MIMSVISSKSLNELDQDFRKAVQRHKFGVLNVLDLKQSSATRASFLNVSAGCTTSVTRRLLRRYLTPI
jgi:hypothetical protein